MSYVPGYSPRYRDLEQDELLWHRLSRAYGGSADVIGHSVEGRALRAYEFGERGGPTILLSALMHGIELIGGLALYDAVRAILEQDGPTPHLVVVPTVNPDAVAANLARVKSGRRAGQRTNARGVDLNRNFGWICERRPWHPFAGSRWRHSPHYTGPEPFSEPETRALRDLARAVSPQVSIGFHSFGNLVLFPWAHTKAPHPRHAEYAALAERFLGALGPERYTAQPACGWYPTVGDLDDWLDDDLGTLAYTVEVSDLDPRRLLSPRRLVDPFFWMNPPDADRVIDNLVPGVQALVAEAQAVLQPAASAPALRSASSTGG